MSTIVDIVARQILDSRGNPTVECEVLLESGVIARASVPSGASVGSKEAVEIRDGDNFKYQGKGVLIAVENINTEISKEIVGVDSIEQAFIDQRLINLDGTSNKSRLGANAILAVSMSVAKAAAKEVGLPLYRYFGGSGPMQMPVPMINIINGGIHANNNLDFQEFMIVPIGQESFREALRCGSEIFHVLKQMLSEQGMSTSVGDEGGFAPDFSNNDQCINMILQSIERAGYRPGEDVMIALDCASSEFFKEGRYHLDGENMQLTSSEFADYLVTLTKKFPIISIEDGMSESDWTGWKDLTDRLKKTTQLVGDDLFATNVEILKEGIDQGIANSILIKINQIGTLTETFATVETAKRLGYTAIISHRSGETESSMIADISVGLNALQIKTGSLSRGERIIKYNQLLRIEEDLGDTTSYPGSSVFYSLSR